MLSNGNLKGHIVLDQALQNKDIESANLDILFKKNCFTPATTTLSSFRNDELDIKPLNTTCISQRVYSKPEVNKKSQVRNSMKIEKIRIDASKRA